MPKQLRLNEKQIAFLKKQEADLEKHAREFQLPTDSSGFDSGLGLLP